MSTIGPKQTWAVAPHMFASDPKRTLSNCQWLISILLLEVAKCWVEWTRNLIDAWHDFYVMRGTSSAALIGLLLVATSLHLGEVMSNPGFRIRAYNARLIGSSVTKSALREVAA